MTSVKDLEPTWCGTSGSSREGTNKESLHCAWGTVRHADQRDVNPDTFGVTKGGARIQDEDDWHRQEVLTPSSVRIGKILSRRLTKWFQTESRTKKTTSERDGRS